MAKSYKKFPLVKQEKVDKHIWNRKLRRKMDLYQRGQYRKCMVNYDNWQYIWTKEDAVQNYYNNVELYKKAHGFETVDDYINYWKRICFRK